MGEQLLELLPELLQCLLHLADSAAEVDHFFFQARYSVIISRMHGW